MTTVQVGQDEALIVLEVPLTLTVAQELRPKLQEAVVQGTAGIVFDLASTSVVDSSGIGLLIATHNTLQKKGGLLRVINASPEIMNLFRAMRLDRHFSVEGRP